MKLYTPPQQADRIPVIDLSGNDRDAAEGIGRACREIGFFYVAGHGIPGELVERQFAAAARVFAVSDAEKQALHMRNSLSSAGFEPIGGQILDSQDGDGTGAPPDLKESFYCTTNCPSDLPRAPTSEPCQNQWPADLAELKQQTLAYGEAMQALGDQVLELIALSLGVPRDWFVPYYQGAAAKLRMLRYPPQPKTSAFNQIGAGAHTDWGGITLLAQDNLGGLEVRDVNGNWVRADPIPETFVVNLGDLMMRWTNGLYASNLHRVRNNAADQDRFSLPFFYSPRGDATIEPIPGCVTAENQRRFETCTAQEHVREMFRRSYGY